MVYCQNMAPAYDFLMLAICSANDNPWDASIFMKRAEMCVIPVEDVFHPKFSRIINATCKGDSLTKTAGAAYIALERLVSGWRESVRAAAPKLSNSVLGDESIVDPATRNALKTEAASNAKKWIPLTPIFSFAFKKNPIFSLLLKKKIQGEIYLSTWTSLLDLL